MRRIIALALPLLLAISSHASGQDWAKKMFEVTKHEFGTVARGSKQEYRFQLKNIYKEDVHIAGVESSCGCTTPKVTKDTLKTFETSEIVAIFNTRSFLGSKAATLTVKIDEPYYAEVQLTVDGYIRSDVVFDPGMIEFGSLDAGEGGKTTVSIAYAGRGDWKIVDVLSANRHFEVELDETYRGGGKVNYDMTVRLKPDIPVGYIHDQLVIVTDDSSIKKVSVPVEGQVMSPMTVSPAALFLGVLKPGESVKKRIVVKGKKPFRIINAKCSDPSITIETPSDDSKLLHFLSVEIRGGDEARKVINTIEIKTDSGICAECVVTGTIEP